MFSRSLAALILTGLVAAPGMAGAQMSTPKPMASGMHGTMKTSTATTSSARHTAAMKTALKKSSSSTNSTQSTHPGANNYSGSSPLGSAEKSPPK